MSSAVQACVADAQESYLQLTRMASGRGIRPMNMKKVSTALLAIGFVIFLPLIAPAAFVCHGVYLRRLRGAADQFKCEGCGQILGRRSIQLADEEWTRRMQEFMNRSPGVKTRVVRNLHAICSRCGRQYQFVEKIRTFVTTPPAKARRLR